MNRTLYKKTKNASNTFAPLAEPYWKPPTKNGGTKMRSTPPRLLLSKQRQIKILPTIKEPVSPNSAIQTLPSMPCLEKKPSETLTYTQNKEARALAMLEYAELSNAWKKFRLQIENNRYFKENPGLKTQLLDFDEQILLLEKIYFCLETDKHWIDLSDEEKNARISKRSSFFSSFVSP